MQTEDFLRRILPPLDGGGCYCWATPAPANSGRRFNQQFPSRIVVAAEGIRQMDALRKNTYYAMAAFQKRGTREQTNVKTLKAFWLDVDCGASKAAEGRGYATKADAARALVAACRTLGLPAPMVVDSGNGLHAYWPLDKSVPSDLWKPVAMQLVAALRSVDLIADYACSTDESRILRPVGTSNWKDPSNPKPVILLRDARDYSLAQVAAPVSSFDVTVPSGATILGGLNADLDIQYDSAPADADRIADGCAQMALMRDSNGRVSEPQWRDCLGVIRSCEDAEGVAIAWSNGHPDFSERDTLAKLRQRKAPTRCETFDRDNPGVCQQCIHWRRITSPIQLGAVDAEPTPVSVVAEPVVIQPSSGAVAPAPISAAEVPRVFTLPASMSKTYRWINGRMEVDKDRIGWTPFAQHFIVFDGQVDIAGESSVLVRALYGEGAVRSFSIPVSELMEVATCKKAFSKRGIAPYNMKDQEMTTYLRRWFDEVSRKASDARQLDHFGWQDNWSFLMGSVLIAPDGTHRQANVAGPMRSLAKAMAPIGDPAEWTRVVNTLYAGPGMEQYHFILGVGFGAPLMKFAATANVNGVTFSALSESGFGKTECERIMMSMYGNPAVLLKSFKGSTMTALYEHIGMMGCLPVVVDEITTIKPEELTTFAYEVSSGQSKMRSHRSGDVREQRAPWHTILQTSSNASLWEKLASKGAVEPAQWLRMLEFNMQRNFRVSPAEARELLSALDGNYGSVGLTYLTYVAQNREVVTRLVLDLMKRVEDATGIVSAERFWSAGVACVVAGLILAKKLGLIDVDPPKVMAWAVDQVKAGRAAMQKAAPGPLMLFRQMCSSLANSVLLTPSLTEGQDVDQRFTNMPHGTLAGRMCFEDRTTWLTASAVRKWCFDNHTSLASMIESAKRAGFIVAEENFDIGKGTALSAAPVPCYKINNTAMQMN